LRVKRSFMTWKNCSCIDWCIVYIQNNTFGIGNVPDNSIIHSSRPLPLRSNCIVQNIVFWKLCFMILFPRYLVLVWKLALRFSIIFWLTWILHKLHDHPQRQSGYLPLYFKKDVWHFFRYVDDNNQPEIYVEVIVKDLGELNRWNTLGWRLLSSQRKIYLTNTNVACVRLNNTDTLKSIYQSTTIDYKNRSQQSGMIGGKYSGSENFYQWSTLVA